LEIDFVLISYYGRVLKKAVIGDTVMTIWFTNIDSCYLNNYLIWCKLYALTISCR